MRIPWTPWERRWRDVLCAAMVPAASADLPGLDSVDTAEFWREYERHAPELLRLGFRASVWALSLAPPLVLGKPTTFAGLASDDRDRLLDEVSSSRFYLVRQLPMTVKLLSCFAYLRDDDVRTRVNELSAK
jgi:hypothetical protein